jgi:Fur family ferric uptake transcriptional regulator
MALDRHFDPTEIERRLAAAGVHRASIYRILPVLEAAGIIRRVRDEHSHWHYEHVVGHQHHDHLVCERCGRVIEFASPEIESEQGRQCRLHGFTETSHHFVIRGVCRQCRAKSSARSGDSRGRR